jgi:hypothetical protein
LDYREGSRKYKASKTRSKYKQIFIGILDGGLSMLQSDNVTIEGKPDEFGQH